MPRDFGYGRMGPRNLFRSGRGGTRSGRVNRTSRGGFTPPPAPQGPTMGTGGSPYRGRVQQPTRPTSPRFPQPTPSRRRNPTVFLGPSAPTRRVPPKVPFSPIGGGGINPLVFLMRLFR